MGCWLRVGLTSMDRMDRIFVQLTPILTFPLKGKELYISLSALDGRGD